MTFTKVILSSGNENSWRKAGNLLHYIMKIQAEERFIYAKRSRLRWTLLAHEIITNVISRKFFPRTKYIFRNFKRIRSFPSLRKITLFVSFPGGNNRNVIKDRKGLVLSDCMKKFSLSARTGFSIVPACICYRQKKIDLTLSLWVSSIDSMWVPRTNLAASLFWLLLL